MKKHSHSWVDEYKGSTKIPLRCRLCPKTFCKGKETPNKAFGTPKVLRENIKRGKGFIIKGG